MTATRPVLAYTVSTLSNFSSATTSEHRSAAKRVLRYLTQTRNLGLTYSHVSNTELTGYSDSDHAGVRDDRKSTSGYVFTLQGAPILWKSNKQSMVTLSSTKAEYVGSSDAARKGIWLHRLLNGFIDARSRNPDAEAPETCGNITATDRLQLRYMNNQSAMKIAMSSTSQVHDRTQHIDIRHHFVRDAYQNGRIGIKYLPTTEITANILTTALPRDAHQRHVKRIGLQSK
jgi:hypothetical protein